MRAPLASAMAVSAGLVWPSWGKKMAPTTSSMLSSGHISWAFFGVISSASTRKALAMAAPRRSSSQRSALVAMEMLPFCFSPVAWPVSFSSLV